AEANTERHPCTQLNKLGFAEKKTQFAEHFSVDAQMIRGEEIGIAECHLCGLAEILCRRWILQGAHQVFVHPLGYRSLAAAGRPAATVVVEGNTQPYQLLEALAQCPVMRHSRTKCNHAFGYLWPVSKYTHGPLFQGRGAINVKTVAQLG